MNIHKVVLTSSYLNFMNLAFSLLMKTESSPIGWFTPHGLSALEKSLRGMVTDCQSVEESENVASYWLRSCLLEPRKTEPKNLSLYFSK